MENKFEYKGTFKMLILSKIDLGLKRIPNNIYVSVDYICSS